ncbi:hypothetical protein IF1G_09818 [Cordyceps javanica]|uniref:Uncharacterized protein n=1 Tax=Cordyceps javanica TaxID=43265 RepID=A0A545VNG9_9HYPO|nr:hypothetical protein IF1G_09818 [Cordyceps javanica]TQW03270.1 hypothetical protein IF2G_09403 [Cordyceps javanica]
MIDVGTRSGWKWLAATSFSLRCDSINWLYHVHLLPDPSLRSSFNGLLLIFQSSRIRRTVKDPNAVVPPECRADKTCKVTATTPATHPLLA